MTGEFAAGLMKGAASAFDDYVQRRERNNKLNEAYTERLLADLDVVGAVSDKNKLIMSNELNNIIQESAADLQKSRKLFSNPYEDDNYRIRLQKRIREANQRFANIKANESSFSRQLEIFNQDKGKVFDPDIAAKGQEAFMRTGVDKPWLVKQAMDMNDILKAAYANPPVNAVPELNVPQGNYLVDRMTYPGVTDQQKNAAINALFQDEGARRGFVRDMVANGDPKEFGNYYKVPAKNTDAFNKYQDQLALISAKQMIPGSGDLSEIELDPQWQQAAFQYHINNTAKKLYEPYVVNRTHVKPAEPGAMTERERFEAQMAKEAEKENKKEITYDVTTNPNLPDDAKVEQAITFREGHKPIVSVNTDDMETMDGPKVPAGTTWNFPVAHIANGYAYLAGDNPAVVKDPTTGNLMLDKQQKVRYIGKIPLSKIQSQLKTNTNVKWADIEQVSGGTKKAEVKAMTTKSKPETVLYVDENGKKFNIPKDKEANITKKYPKLKKVK